jgi:hypothetical protein
MLPPCVLRLKSGIRIIEEGHRYPGGIAVFIFYPPRTMNSSISDAERNLASSSCDVKGVGIDGLGA